jgi:hypothetical protein
MRDDRNGLSDIACPLCGQAGTLRPIRFRRRMRVGLLSFVNSLGKDFECAACGGMFAADQLIAKAQPTFSRK